MASPSTGPEAGAQWPILACSGVQFGSADAGSVASDGGVVVSAAGILQWPISACSALENGALVGSAGEGRLSLTTRADYAQAAAIVLTSDGHEGKTYELAGDDAVTLADLAAEISRQTGRNIPYRDLPQAEYAAILKQVGLPEGFAEGLAAWDVDASNGALFDDGHQLSKLIGRPTTPLADAVRAQLAAQG